MITRSLAEQLRNAQHVVVFTGAGASAESGIPTFRNALTGLWERFDPAHLRPAKHSELIHHCVGDGTSGAG